MEESTFLKALLGNQTIKRSGKWAIPPVGDIGYLDQQYSTLDQELTVFEIIRKSAPQCNDKEIRKHLNDFLFSKQEEVLNKVTNLSGGERARLSLASIAAQNPRVCYWMK